MIETMKTKGSVDYKCLPLEKKKELIQKITEFQEIFVCEDESEAYDDWK